MVGGWGKKETLSQNGDPRFRSFAHPHYPSFTSLLFTHRYALLATSKPVVLADPLPPTTALVNSFLFANAVGGRAAEHLSSKTRIR